MQPAVQNIILNSTGVCKNTCTSLHVSLSLCFVRQSAQQDLGHEFRYIIAVWKKLRTSAWHALCMSAWKRRKRHGSRRQGGSQLPVLPCCCQIGISQATSPVRHGQRLSWTNWPLISAKRACTRSSFRMRSGCQPSCCGRNITARPGWDGYHPCAAGIILWGAQQPAREAAAPATSDTLSELSHDVDDSGVV